MAAKPTCRIYAIIARDGRSAVVFRRGRSKRVLLLRWWLTSDTIEHGQWFKGMLYPRASDLSPDGELLVYNAEKFNYRLPEKRWTAISRPPYLTALKIWFGGGRYWGGGIFEDQTTIDLDLQEKDRRQGEGRADHGRLKIAPTGPTAGKGALLIDHRRRTRDGWQLTSSDQPVTWEKTKVGNTWARPALPLVYEMPCPDRQRAIRAPKLRHEIQSWDEWPSLNQPDVYTLVDPVGHTLRSLESCSWADWQPTGDLLFAIGGCLYRLPHKHVAANASHALDGAKLVADLSDLTFEEVVAPPEALQWPGSS